jgi:hypothetical protein
MNEMSKDVVVAEKCSRGDGAEECMHMRAAEEAKRGFLLHDCIKPAPHTVLMCQYLSIYLKQSLLLLIFERAAFRKNVLREGDFFGKLQFARDIPRTGSQHSAYMQTVPPYIAIILSPELWVPKRSPFRLHLS